MDVCEGACTCVSLPLPLVNPCSLSLHYELRQEESLVNVRGAASFGSVGGAVNPIRLILYKRNVRTCVSNLSIQGSRGCLSHVVSTYLGAASRHSITPPFLEST